MSTGNVWLHQISHAGGVSHGLSLDFEGCPVVKTTAENAERAIETWPHDFEVLGPAGESEGDTAPSCASRHASAAPAEKSPEQPSEPAAPAEKEPAVVTWNTAVEKPNKSK